MLPAAQPGDRPRRDAVVVPLISGGGLRKDHHAVAGELVDQVHECRKLRFEACLLRREAGSGGPLARPAHRRRRRRGRPAMRADRPGPAAAAQG